MRDATPLMPKWCAQWGFQMKTNYAAVVVAAIVYWLLGAVWYGALFSKQWMALENMSAEKAASLGQVR